MKKSILIVIIFGLAFCYFTLCSWGKNINIITEKENFDGRYVLESFDSNNTAVVMAISSYLAGVLDTLEKTQLKKMQKLYPHSTRAEIVDALVNYYRNNSTKRYRAVVDVILSGCK